MFFSLMVRQRRTSFSYTKKQKRWRKSM